MVEGGERGAVAMLDLVVEVFVFLKQHGYLIGIEIELKMRIVYKVFIPFQCFKWNKASQLCLQKWNKDY